MVWWWFAYCSLILAFWWCDSLVDNRSIGYELDWGDRDCLMALTVGSHGVVNGDWVGMGLFVL